MVQTDATTQPASDATMVDNPRIVRRRKPVLILTAASLLCSLVSLIDNFFTYGYSGYDNINQYALHFKTLTLQNVLFIILNVLEIAPAALLFLHVLFLFKRRKAAVLIPAAFACVAITNPLYFTLKTISDVMQYKTSSSLSTGALVSIIIGYMFTYLSFSLLFALAVPGALKGLRQKAFVIICTV